jgi:GNAT superfamily N-acetyltransferase
VNRTQAGRAGGRTAAIRPACPADLAALRDFFAGLSAQTRYLRFFAPLTPSSALLRLLSGGTGTTNAVVATWGGIIIGHAIAADRADPRGARMTDIGVVVADAWQGRGVGSALVRALIIRAQARGVTSVTMDVLPSNHQVLAMIAGHWPAAHTGRFPDYDTICIQLPHRPQHRPQARPARPGPRQSARPATARPLAVQQDSPPRRTGVPSRVSPCG